MAEAPSPPEAGAKPAARDAYVVSLLSEGKVEAAFRVVNEHPDRALFWSEFHRYGAQALARGDLSAAHDAFEKARAHYTHQSGRRSASGRTARRCHCRL